MTAVGGSQGSTGPSSPNTLDTSTAEAVASTVFRVLFRDGVRFPLQIPEVMDMEVAIRDNHILVNTNQVQFGLPELSIWRITFAHHGKPVVEFGHGVRHNVRVHYGRAFFFLVENWKARRARRHAQSDRDAASFRRLTRFAHRGPTTGSRDSHA